jgi:hypothetical protein
LSKMVLNSLVYIALVIIVIIVIVYLLRFLFGILFLAPIGFESSTSLNMLGVFEQFFLP